MKKCFIYVIALLLLLSISTPTFAAEGNILEDVELDSNLFNEFGIKKGVTILPENNENASRINSLSTLSTTSSKWETLPEKSNISLNKDWTIAVSRTFTIDDIDGIVIEKDGAFIPIRIRLFPTAKEIKVTPQESYLPSTKYSLRVFLNNGKRYEMYFNTNADGIYNGQYGNTAGNVINKGLVAENNGWIYYSNSNDGYKLYKQKTDGTQRTKLTDHQSSQINVIGGWVYYRISEYAGMQKVRIDGTENTIIAYDNAKNITVSDDGWIYYTNNDRDMYKIRYDGSNRTDLSDNKTSGVYPNVLNGILYIGLGNFENNKLYKYDIKNDLSTELTDERVSYINVVDNWIYYINPNDSRIYKIGTDGTAKMKLNDSWTEGLNVHNGWAYYVNSEDRSIYRIRLDGTNEQRLNDSPSADINVISDWIYYEDPTTNKYYRMHHDGSGWEEVY